MLKSHQQFFEKALAIQAQRREKLSEAEKKEIALDLGFSEADWQAVQDSFQSHLDRGTEFLKRRNYEKAITELEDALIIQPEHTDTLAALAQAYLGVFQTKKRKNLKEKALQYAQECLLYSPKNQVAHQVIDYFNPNQIQPYSFTKTQSTTTPKTSPKKEQHPLRYMGIIMWGGMGFVVLLGLYLELVKPYLKKNKLAKKQQETKYTYTPPIIEYETKNTVNFELATVLPEAVQKKGYRLEQKDSLTWLLSTSGKVPVFEMKLTKNLWQHTKDKDAKTGKKSEWDLFSGLIQVTTLCDSIRYDALLFRLDLYDPQEHTQIYFTHDSIRLGESETYKNFLPNQYHFKTNEVSTLYLRTGSSWLPTEKVMQYRGKKPSKIVLSIQKLEMNPPPEAMNKVLELKTNPNISQPPVKVEVLDELFFPEPGSPYTIHLWVWKIYNLHPEKTIKSFLVHIDYYDKNKKLIKQTGEWIVDNLSPLPPASEKIHRLCIALNENNFRDPSVPIKKEDIAYTEVKIQEVQWE
jgi:tetratricopeptide (TPR) repeat protein